MSIPGAAFSRVAATAFVQTLSDRTLAVIERGEQILDVKLSGPAPQARRLADGAVVAETNLVVAVIEEQDP
jgi:hypothetical protein